MVFIKCTLLTPWGGIHTYQTLAEAGKHITGLQNTLSFTTLTYNPYRVYTDYSDHILGFPWLSLGNSSELLVTTITNTTVVGRGAGTNLYVEKI